MSVSYVSRSINVATPKTIISVANRTEVHQRDSHVVGKLAPGTSAPLSSGTERLRATNDDTITFSNGGSIADLPGEGGLLLTSPDGSQQKLSNYGWIDANHKENRAEVNFKVRNPYTDDYEHWTQGFNADGTVALNRILDQDAPAVYSEIAQDGSMAAWSKDWEGKDYSPNVSLRNGNITFDDRNMERIAIAPPVPMEWLISN